MAPRSSPKTLQRFNRFIAMNMGLHYSEARLAELEQKMLAASRELGYETVEECLLRLMAAPLDRQQLQTLARFLTVGETYFLRDPHSYRVLEEQLLPQLLKRRGAEKRLRIWSAGCSTGEEPYSIAILLTRLIPDLASWQISLHGTDINPDALAKARRGVYGAWSFRDAPPWLSRYFKVRPDGRREIAAGIREMVTFSHLNLATESSDSLFPGHGIDLIFCRNVMLYFSPQVKERVVAHFHESLADGGHLFVSPAELEHRFFQDFTCRRFPGALVLCKDAAVDTVDTVDTVEQSRYLTGLAGGAAPLPLFLSDGHASEAAAPLPPPARGVAPAPAASAPFAEVAAENAVDADALALQARKLAGVGRLAEARRLCEEAIAADRLRAGNHYLLSTILEEQGLAEEAAQSLRTALYLDQDFLPAHLALGNLARQAGRGAASRRHFDNALRLLERHESHEVLPEAEGMTAGALTEVVRRALLENKV